MAHDSAGCGSFNGGTIGCISCSAIHGFLVFLFQRPNNPPMPLLHRSSKYRGGWAINRKGSENRVGLFCMSRLTDILEPAAKPESGVLIGGVHVCGPGSVVMSPILGTTCFFLHFN